MIVIAIMPSYDIILTHVFFTEKPGTQYPETYLKRKYVRIFRILACKAKTKLSCQNY